MQTVARTEASRGNPGGWSAHVLEAFGIRIFEPRNFGRLPYLSVLRGVR